MTKLKDVLKNYVEPLDEQQRFEELNIDIEKSGGCFLNRIFTIIIKVKKQIVTEIDGQKLNKPIELNLNQTFPWRIFEQKAIEIKIVDMDNIY